MRALLAPIKLAGRAALSEDTREKALAWRMLA